MPENHTTVRSDSSGCGLLIAALVLLWFIGECNSRHRKDAYDRGYQDRAYNEYNPSPPDNYNYDD